MADPHPSDERSNAIEGNILPLHWLSSGITRQQNKVPQTIAITSAQAMRYRRRATSVSGVTELLI